MPGSNSPVIVGAEADSPQPTLPSSASMRTSKFSASAITTPAIFIGRSIGSRTGMASTRAIFKSIRSTQFDTG